MARRLDEPHIRLGLALFDDPRLDGLAAGDEVAVLGLIGLAFAYCFTARTDGEIRAAKWARTGTARARRLAVSAGFAEPTDDGVYLPDYLRWNRSREDAETLSETRRQAARSRWDSDASSNAFSNASRTANRNANRSASSNAEQSRDSGIGRSLTGPSRAGARGDDPRPDDDAQPDYRRGPGRAAERDRYDRPVARRTDDRPPAASSLCGRCGGHHNARDCPALNDTDEPPARGPRTPVYAGPRRIVQPPEVAERGAAYAKQLLAEAAAARHAGDGDRPAEPGPNRSPERNEVEASLNTRTEPDDPGSEQPPF